MHALAVVAWAGGRMPWRIVALLVVMARSAEAADTSGGGASAEEIEGEVEIVTSW